MPPFASAKQRKYVMRKLKKEGFQKKPLEIGITKNYYRARLRQPNRFNRNSFKTIDIGKPGGTKIVIGRPIGGNKIRTQSVLIRRR